MSGPSSYNNVGSSSSGRGAYGGSSSQPAAPVSGSMVYGLVARGPIVLAEHATTTGNFTTVTQHILEKIPPGDSKMTYVYDRYLFHYVQKNNIIYMCLADDTFGRRIPFAFLDDISNKFESVYGARGQTAIAYGLQEFSKYISIQMEYYSKNPSADRFRQVQGEIDQVKDVMVANIEKVLERGERIDILVDKTDTLNQASFAFRKRSTALRRAMWWKNQKLMYTMGGLGVLMLYFVLMVASQRKGIKRIEDSKIHYTKPHMGKKPMKAMATSIKGKTDKPLPPTPSKKGKR